MLGLITSGSGRVTLVTALAVTNAHDAEFHFRLRHRLLVQCVYKTPGFGIHSCVHMSQWLTVAWRWLMRLLHEGIDWQG